MQHSLNKHRKKRFDPYSGEESTPEFQVAPMVDVLLVLLLFFMATATAEMVSRPPELELPVADSVEGPKEHPGQSVVNVERFNFQLRLDEQAFEKSADLVPYLKKAKENDRLVRGDSQVDYRVLIRADRETPYSLIKEIMQACSRAGIANVTFAVTPAGEMTQAASPNGGSN